MDRAETVPQTVFATLEDAADTLRDALRAAEHFNRKVRGSIPQDALGNKDEEPTLKRLVEEVAWLSRAVKSEIETHHQMVGDSREKPMQTASSSPGIMKGRAASGY